MKLFFTITIIGVVARVVAGETTGVIDITSSYDRFCFESSATFLPYHDEKLADPYLVLQNPERFTVRDQTDFDKEKQGLWIRFKIKNETGSPTEFYLNGKLYDYVTLYRLGETLDTVATTGYLVPFDEKPVKDWDANLSFHLENKETGEYLLHLQSVTKVSKAVATVFDDMCLTLYPKKAYDKGHHLPRFLLYAFMGSLLMIAIYYFSISINSSFQEYWLFALYNLGVFLSTFFLTAQPYELGLFDVFSFERNLRYATVPLSCMAYLSFSWRLLNIRNLNSVCGSIIKATFWVYPVIVLLLLFSFFKEAYFLFLISVPFFLFSITTLAVFNYHKKVEARYFVVGHLLVGLTGVIHIFSNFEWISLRVGCVSNFVGILAEIVVLSFAITKKFSVLNHQKLQVEYEQKQQEDTLKTELKKRKELEVELEEKVRSLTSASVQWTNINEKLENLERKIKKSIDGGNAIAAKEELIKEIGEIKTFQDHWENFKLHFESVHPRFFQSIKENYPKLTKNDIRLLAYLKMELTNQEISMILNVTKRSVEQAKRRMRLKMELNPESDIIYEVEKVKNNY